jgi:hypothetical protein
VRGPVEIKTIQPFLHYFGNVRERTMRVARCIPPDKIDWTYAPEKFTLGDILRHLRKRAVPTRPLHDSR